MMVSLASDFGEARRFARNQATRKDESRAHIDSSVFSSSDETIGRNNERAPSSFLKDLGGSMMMSLS